MHILHVKVHYSNHAMLKFHFIVNQQLKRLLEAYLLHGFYSYKMPGKYQIFEIQYFIYSVL